MNLIVSFFIAMIPIQAFSSLQQHEADDIVYNQAVETDLEIFIVDEDEIGVTLDELTDEEIFGEDGLLSYLGEYEAEADSKKKKPARRRGPKALPRSCAAPASGIASFYGKGFHGRKTANGEIYNMHSLTAAHKTISFHSLVKVTYKGRSVIVRINDAGPYHGNRVIDLSVEAARQLGMTKAGLGHVSLQIVRCSKGRT